MKVFCVTIIISRQRTRLPCKDAAHATDVCAALRQRLGPQVFISEPIEIDQFDQSEPEAHRAEIMIGWSRNSEE